MECSRCKQPIPEGESCNFNGKILCEDCYVQAVEPRRTCDVAAVHAAKTHREQSGQTGSEGLTEQQKLIYEYVVAHPQTPKKDLARKLGLSNEIVENHLTTLRHCELIKSRKIGNEIVVVPFDFE